VVLIDVEVAVGFDRHVERPVPGEQFQHVIEEADAGGDFIGAGSIDVQRSADLGLVGVAFEFGAAGDGQTRCSSI
jgi:hypothetical protein